MTFRYLSLVLTVFSLLLAGELHAQKTLLNVSYDPTRELYKEFNPAFIKYWQSKTGESVLFKQAHGGSGAQARTGDSAHSASKALPQRKIRPPKPVQPRDERCSKCKSIPRRPDPLDFRSRSQYLHRRKKPSLTEKPCRENPFCL